jgi:flagellar biosynthesis protein FliP
MRRSVLAAIPLVFSATAALGQTAGPLEQLTGPLVSGEILRTAALITVLSVGPGLMVMVTSFTRLIIAFSFLRAGLGLQSTPANLILITLSLFLTAFIMGPTFEKAYSEGFQPLQEGKITETAALSRIAAPFRVFMLANVREKDLGLFQDLAGPSAQGPEVAMRILIPAFMTSELRRGFEIGFLIALPFLIIDLIVATLTMSMGMMMLPPTAISLPFKVLFFVLIDGWHLLVGSLVRSFN